jgi:predicted acyltransferase
MPRLDPTESITLTELVCPWPMYRAGESLLQTIAANVDNAQMTDAVFRDFVRRAVMPRADTSG